nr:MAG TPA: hypothetical protein [Caudoviricetes sp.]
MKVDIKYCLENNISGSFPALFRMRGRKPR